MRIREVMIGLAVVFFGYGFAMEFLRHHGAAWAFVVGAAFALGALLAPMYDHFRENRKPKPDTYHLS